jgi:hypothetical protein
LQKYGKLTEETENKVSQKIGMIITEHKQNMHHAIVTEHKQNMHHAIVDFILWSKKERKIPNLTC